MKKFLILCLLLSPVSVWGQAKIACSVTIGNNLVGTGYNRPGTIFGTVLGAQPGNQVVDTIWGYYSGSGAFGFACIYSSNQSNLCTVTAVQAVTTGWNKFPLAGPITLDQTNGYNYSVCDQFSDGYVNLTPSGNYILTNPQVYDGTIDNSSLSRTLGTGDDPAVFADYCSNPVVYPPSCAMTLGSNIIGNQLTNSGGGAATMRANNLTVTAPTTINCGWVYNWGPATNGMFGIYLHTTGKSCVTPSSVLVATSASTAIPATSWYKIPLTASYAMSTNGPSSGQYFLMEFLENNCYTNGNSETVYSAPLTGTFFQPVTYTGTFPPNIDCIYDLDTNWLSDFVDFCQTATHSHGDLLGVWW